MLTLDNERLIDAIEMFIHRGKVEAYEANLKPMSLQEFYDEINQALSDDKNNRLISTEDLKNKIREWT